VADGGSAAGLAWLRGTRERCAVVSASSLGAEERGDEGVEAHGESRVGWHLVAVTGRGKNGFSFGPTARRDDARGSGGMRHEWSGRGGQSTAPTRGSGSSHAAVAHARRQRPCAI
jgi:hypothetical protein